MKPGFMSVDGFLPAEVFSLSELVIASLIFLVLVSMLAYYFLKDD